MKIPIPSLRDTARTMSCVMAFAAAAVSSLHAASYSWDGGGTTDTWGNATNWNPNGVPVFDNTADLEFNVSVRSTNWIGAIRTNRSLTFGTNLNTTFMVNLQDFLGGSGTARNLTMDADSGNATITVAAGVTNTIRVGNSGGGGVHGSLVLADNLDIVHNGSADLQINRPIDGAFGITKTGTGQLVLQTTNTYTGKTVLAGGRILMSAASDLRLGAAPTNYTADSLTISNGGFLVTSNSSSTNLIWNTNRGITIGAGGATWQITGFADTILGGTNMLSGSGDLMKAGSGTLTIANSNAFSGTFRTTNSFPGFVNLNHQFALANATLILTNGGAVPSFGSVAGTDFTLGGLAASASGTGSDLALTNTAGQMMTLKVGQNNQSTVYNGILSNGTNGILSQGGSLVKVGSGTLQLGGANSFSGSLTVSNGTVLATRFSTTGDFETASSINLDGGALIYDPNFNNKGLTNAPVVVNSASTLGWRNQSEFNYNLSFVGSAGFTLNADLTITNASTDTTLANAIIIGRNMTGAGNLINKGYNNISSPTNNYGPGRLNLSGTNTNWNGNLVIARGTVTFGLPTSIGNGSLILGATGDSFGAGLTGFVATNVAPANSTITFTNPIIVRSGGFRSINIGSDQRFVFSGNVTLEGSLNVNSGTFFNDRILTFSGDISGVGGLDLTRGSGGAINLVGSNSYSGPTTISNGADVVVNSLSGNAIGDVSAVTISGFNTATNQSGGTNSRLRIVTSETIGSLSAPTANAELLILTNAMLTTGGDNSSTTFGGNSAGAGGLTKVGTGTFTLAGSNRYTGNTVVDGGQLVFGTNSSLTLFIGGSGTNNSVGGAGTAFFRGTLNLDLASASTNLGDAWSVVTVAVPAYDGSFQVSGFTNNGGNWTLGTNGVIYRFSQSIGVLLVTNAPTNNYDSWVSYWQGVDTNFTDTAGTADPDGDQFDNNKEFAFDGNPTVGSPALLTATKSGTNTVFNYVALNTDATYTVKSTTNLATGPWTNAAVTVTNAGDQSGINLPSDYTRREFTVPGVGNLFFQVEASFTP